MKVISTKNKTKPIKKTMKNVLPGFKRLTGWAITNAGLLVILFGYVGVDMNEEGLRMIIDNLELMVGSVLSAIGAAVYIVGHIYRKK